jgi:hypothetical protein
LVIDLIDKIVFCIRPTLARLSQPDVSLVSGGHAAGYGPDTVPSHATSPEVLRERS